MSLCNLPEMPGNQRLAKAQFNLRPDALARWRPEVYGQTGDDTATISIYDPIGEGLDGSGVTAGRISAALRSIGTRDVIVNVNSPGGDFFEGVAIYNLLREHKARVTVRVMGLAASAASLIVMSGDDILMGDGAFLMIHNAWAVAVGNRHDLADASASLAPIDAAMAKLYAQRSGMDKDDAARLMDQETWFSGPQALERGLATGLLDDGGPNASAGSDGSRRKCIALIESSLAQAGYSLKQRHATIRGLFHDQASADKEIAVSLQHLINLIQG
ncbi:head maturation protease, ClpP-related [Paraburkholderia azotifigens]|uniref:head maturation protease, ClpP-related n=1 Tax=Paraburkholderia azotifigens TaxID=2057004 RepID=UPI003171FFDF